MFYQADSNDHRLPYDPIKTRVVGRPIGRIATVSAAGAVNPAPFGVVNVPSDDPAYGTFAAAARDAAE